MGNKQLEPRIPDEVQNLLDTYERERKEIVRLSGKHLIFVPLQMAQWDWMSEFNFSSNSIDLKSSGEVLAKLVNLKKLILANNSISDLPPTLSSLMNLNTLGLKSNKFISVPEVVEKLTGLEFLDISDNSITEFPIHLSGLTKISRLNFTRNKISVIPANSLGTLLTLKELEFTENLVEEIPEDANNLTNLVYADFSANKIRKFPSQLLELKSLAVLMLPNNLIGAIPSCTIPASITMLDIKSNLLVDIPDIQFNCDPNAFSTDVPDLIVPGVYLGPETATKNLSLLRAKKITHILRILVGVPPEYPSDFKYLVVEEWDSDTAQISAHFRKSIEFIEEALEGGGNVLIHCQYGKSRSATITTAFLMHHKKMTAESALAYLKEKRPKAKPNPNFMKQLNEWEKRDAC